MSTRDEPFRGEYKGDIIDPIDGAETAIVGHFDAYTCLKLLGPRGGVRLHKHLLGVSAKQLARVLHLKEVTE